MKAEQAREIAEKTADEKEKTESAAALTQIYSVIITRAKQGHFTYDVDEISKTNMKILKEEGYTVLKQSGGQYDPDYYRISW